MDIPLFSIALREARDRAGLSTNDAAVNAGIHPNNLSRLERAPRSFNGPAWMTVYRVIVGNNLDLSAFFPDSVILASADAIRARRRKMNRMNE